MMQGTGFDNESYLREQTAAILERLDRCEGKLYLEFGGKLLYDYHAARVLPGFDPNIKIRLLQALGARAAILLCIHAGDIERNKVRADFGITYDSDAMKLMDDLRARGLTPAGVVVTRFEGQATAQHFMNRLSRRGVPVFTHRPTPGYPADIDLILSPAGYGSNPYVETDHPLVVVTGPGPGSGKLATCLTMLYHDHLNGRPAGYAKFETFPVWDLPLKHPVNVAYEAATADLKDVNLMDPFHREAYGVEAVTYNRDLEAFPLVRGILERIGQGTGYRSPTDMGVNRLSRGIVDEEAVAAAARQEIVRRYYHYRCEYALGLAEKSCLERMDRLLEELRIVPEDRIAAAAARRAAEEALNRADKGHDGILCAAALALRDGSIVTGKNSPLLHAASSVVLNAIKQLAGIPDGIHLLPPLVTSSIGKMKQGLLNDGHISLNLEETLIALGMSAAFNPAAEAAMEHLKHLRGCEMHLTHIPPPGDAGGLRKLGLHVTSDPEFPTKNLYVS